MFAALAIAVIAPVSVPIDVTSTELTSIQQVYDYCSARSRVEFLVLYALDPGMLPAEDSIESALRFYETDGESISIDGAFQEFEHDFGVLDSTFVDLAAACVLEVTDPPLRVQDHMNGTRAIDGMQTDSWGDFNAQWTYHPDDGVNLTVWAEEPESLELEVPALVDVVTGSSTPDDA